MAGYYDRTDIRITESDFVAKAKNHGWELIARQQGQEVSQSTYKKEHVKIRADHYAGAFARLCLLAKTPKGGFKIIKNLIRKIKYRHDIDEFFDYANDLASQPAPVPAKRAPKGSAKKQLPKARDFIDDVTIDGTHLKINSIAHSYRFKGVVTINEETGQIEDALEPDVESWAMITVYTTTRNGYSSWTDMITNQKQWHKVQLVHYPSKGCNIPRIVKPHFDLTKGDLAAITRLIQHCTT